MSKKDVKRFWCYFCNKGFATEEQLFNHQKMIHWRCPKCGAIKFSSKQLMSHVSKAHKEILKKVPNAIEGRDNPNNNVRGMDGIPEETYISWRSQIDPNFKEIANNVAPEGAFIANESTRLAANNIRSAQKNIAFNQVNLFQHANVGASNMGTLITAKGAVSSNSLNMNSGLSKIHHSAATQRIFDSHMVLAKSIIEDAEKEAEAKRKKLCKKKRKGEVMYFVPEGDLSVFEMRANYINSHK